jgi:heat shock protein HtpX
MVGSKFLPIFFRKKVIKMFENIKKNKIESGIIVGIFIVVITLIVYYICNALKLGTASIIIALVVSILSAWSSYYYSDKIVLSLNKARPATREEDLKLVNILDALMVASGLTTKPRLYVVEDAQPNAFATGRNPENAVICVTTGLLEKLDYYELEGVIAHEMSHIKNYDIRLSCVVSVMVGFIVMLSDMFSRALLWGGNSKNRDSDNKGNGILMLIGFICLILSPIFGSLMQLALSRKREFLADSTAVEFTRNPDGLISALEKLENDPNQLETANNATANMYIVNPFKKDASGEKKKTSDIWSTHPSTEARIEALRNLK